MPVLEAPPQAAPAPQPSPASRRLAPLLIGLAVVLLIAVGAAWVRHAGHPAQEFSTTGYIRVGELDGQTFWAQPLTSADGIRQLSVVSTGDLGQMCHGTSPFESPPGIRLFACDTRVNGVGAEYAVLVPLNARKVYGGNIPLTILPPPPGWSVALAVAVVRGSPLPKDGGGESRSPGRVVMFSADGKPIP